jgi:1-hydroxy-2-methyl-2-(E)-butenyl 4-diphosphate synthase
VSESAIISPFELVSPEVPRPRRFRTREVRIGKLTVGGGHPVLVQSMTIADTCDTDAVVAEIRTLVEVGCPLVRVTAPSIKDAENLREIRRRLDAAGIDVPLVADIHFTPNAALVAAEIVDKVRINPGNYADRKKFQVFEISDQEYRAELERIRDRFLPLVRKLKEHGTALRIGTNHGSLSDRIMNRYGDTPEGMVESALEFVRICREEAFHDIVLSMKSSIPSVMIAAYRLLVHRMSEEGMDYPLHVGVTEAGNGLEGRIKSAVGIGSLLASGLGDTIRVSLTEDSEHEIPACEAILRAIEQEVPSIGKYDQAVHANVSIEQARSTSTSNEPGVQGVQADRADALSSGRTSPIEPVVHSSQVTDVWRTLGHSAVVTRRRTASWSLRGLGVGDKHPVRAELRLLLSAGSTLDSRARHELARIGRPRGPELVSVRMDGTTTAESIAAAYARLREVREAAPAAPFILEWTDPFVSLSDLTSLLESVDGLSIAPPVAVGGLDRVAGPDAFAAVGPDESAGSLDRPRARAIALACHESGRFLRWRLAPWMPPSIATALSEESRAAGGHACGFVCDPGPLHIARIRAVAEALRETDDLIFLEAWSVGPSGPIVGSFLCDGIGDALCLVDRAPIDAANRTGDPTAGTGVEIAPDGNGATLRGSHVTAQSGGVPTRAASSSPWPAGGVAWEEEPISSAYQILQACRVRLTRAEFIACPSCGRTQFDLQTTTARIRERTGHLRGVKIAIMGCIVNGPGEMADADFGYVGSGPGKIDLYVGKERVEKSVPESEAAEKLIQLLQAHDAWVDPGSEDREP